jgi:(p)ppGpp synthase/HD superfamily hydrolase
MAHLLSVCAIAQADGGSEDEAVAALLHDSLEDKPTETSEQMLRDRFGERVVQLVRIATDTPADWDGSTPKPPWRARKEAYIAHIAEVPGNLLRPIVADKIDNVRALLVDYRRIGDRLWDRFKAGKEDQLWYYRACCQAYEKSGASPTLVSDLRTLVDQLTIAVEAHPRPL